MHERGWASTLSGCARRFAVYSDDPRTIFLRRKQYCRYGNQLVLDRRRRRNHVRLRGCGRSALAAMTGPVTLEVFRCTVPRILASTTPHGGGLQTHQARMIDQRDSRIHGRADSEWGLQEKIEQVTHSRNQRGIFIYVVSLATRGTTKLSAERAVIFDQATSVWTAQ